MELEQVDVVGSRAGGFSGRARIEDSPREVTDAASLIEPLPGVHVRRFGADDGFATISVRGSSSSQVAIYLAGVPLSGGADPSLDLATLPLWPGSEARVFRSFAPAAIGPGSLGGTLVLDPPRLGAPVATEAWAAGGSFGARRVRVGDVREVGDGRVVTALSASRSDDDFEYYDRLTPALARRANAGHAALNGLVAWTVPFRGGALTVTTMAQARRQHLPGTIDVPTPFQALESNRELAAIELSRSAGSGVFRVRGWARRENLRFSDDARSVTLGPTHDDDAIVASGASAGWRGAVGESALVEARLDGSGERFAPGGYVGAPTPPGATRASGGAAFDGEWRPHRALTVAASSRLDGWADDGGANGSKNELHPTGHLGLEAILGAIAIAAHGGAVARPPSFVERYGNRGAFIGEPALRPESAWTLDAGARLARRIGAVRLDLEVSGFASWAEDLIVFVPRGFGGRAKATNIGSARLLGVEAEVRARVGRSFDARVSYTGLTTANGAECAITTFGAPCERPPLPGRPEHDLVADVAYQLGLARLRYGVDALSGVSADLTGTVHVPARILQSAGLRVDVPRVRGLRVALDVRNLFDVRAATYAGFAGPERLPIGDVFAYPLPGRSFLLTARFTETPGRDLRDPSR